MNFRGNENKSFKTLYRNGYTKSVAAFLVAALLSAFVGNQFFKQPTSANSSLPVDVVNGDLNDRRVTDLDVNLSNFKIINPTTAQLNALNALKTNLNDSEITVRWDKATGSIDTIMDFASAPSQLDPESAARQFIAQNAGLFGISNVNTLKLETKTEALRGHLLYFAQTYNGLPVARGGIGLVMDGQNRVKMVSGPYHKINNLNAIPSLTGALAIAKAQADLAQFKVEWVPGVAEVLNPALDKIAGQLGDFAVPSPVLNVFPTPDGARLAWNFKVFSRNPFGFFEYQIDAVNGSVLYREDHVRYQQAPEVLPFTADVFPTFPCITDRLKNEGIIENDPATGKPCGQKRIKLRKFDQSNIVTGLNGTLTGTHAHIENALIDKLPFAQAAKGTWHFAKDDPANLEGRTNELNNHGPLAEPAEHQDEIVQFYYINSLIEYIDHLHRAGDSVHNRIAQGDFPDTYPNQSSPLIGNVHIPNVLAPPTNPQDPEFADKLLGLDNAFSISTSRDVAGQKVVVNPTSYGHGFLFNDLALDFGVPYHEGMHSISSPIAGLQGAPEGGALNEGQADLWAYTAAENPFLGAYVVNAFKLRNNTRATGGNPDLRQSIRHADSGLSYSQLGTRNGNAFEVHRDGEIYASTMWDIRELMLMYQTANRFKRPNVETGALDVPTSVGKETWERLLLGTIYVLSTFNPDTMVRARDAMIIADQALYPSDATDVDAPGQNRAIIEQVFASRELGSNAAAPVGGRQTISTQVSEFTAAQNRLSAPTGVEATIASPTSVEVSWQPVAGAFAYEILKREQGKENKRQNAPVSTRPYIDGDASTDGYLHVEYVPASQTSYVDNGFIEGGFKARGLRNAIAGDYVVRAINVNPNRQIGVSANSASAKVPSAILDVTAQVRSNLSNIVFANGKTEFDQTLTNLGGAGTGEGTMFQPVDFRIVRISTPAVTVANADNGGTGQTGSPASFVYNQNLASGQTSAIRHLVFNNAAIQLFTFDAVVTARVQTDSSQAALAGGDQSNATAKQSGESSVTDSADESVNTVFESKTIRFTVNPQTNQVTAKVLE